MQHTTFINPLARTLLVVSLIICLLSGVTFAALQSQNTLTGSSITTATATMLVSRDGTSYATTQSGFSFTNLVPGGASVPGNGGYDIFLKNAGGTPLSPRFAVSSTPTNPDDVDLAKVNVIMSAGTSGQSQTFTLQSLIDSSTTGGLALSSLAVLFPDQVYAYKIQVSMAKDAFSGTSAAIGAIDFTLTGTAVN